MKSKDLIIFLLFGCIYITVEIMFRGFKNIDYFGLSLTGYTSVYMFFIGGLSAYLVGLINEYSNLNILTQCVIGGIIITAIEFISGCIFNIWLFPNNPLWDYSDLPYNFKGQICLIFSLSWAFLCPCIIKTDDFLRRHLI